MTAASRKAYVDTTSGQLHYRHAGEGDAIVFLQLLPFASLMFEPVLPHFAQRNYACYAFDLMGYGRSDKQQDELLVEDHADQLEEAFNSLGISPKYIVGGHFGGLVAVELVERSGGAIERLVLEGVPLWNAQKRSERLAKTPAPAPVPEDGSSILKIWQSTCSALKNMDPDAVFDANSEAAFMDAFIASLEMQYKPGKAKAFFSFETLDKLEAITTPTLVVGSSTDTLSEYHDSAVQLIPGSRGHRFEGSHPLYRIARNRTGEHVSEYVDLLDGFFRSAAS